MKQIVNSVSLRRGTATALCLSLLIYLPLRVSSAATATRASADLKSESQFRSEASRYENAVRAVSGIGTMKLETTDDLKRAFALLDRENPNLKLCFSKLVVLAISDSTFSNAVKKRIPDRQAAETLAKELEANRKAVLNLDGAESLTSRLQKSADSDAAILKGAGERLKEAAEKIKKTSQASLTPGPGHETEFQVLRATFSRVTTHDAAARALFIVPEILIAALFVVVVVIVSALYARFLIRTREQGEGQALADCFAAADARLSNCLAEANIFTLAVCYATNLIDKAACLA